MLTYCDDDGEGPLDEGLDLDVRAVFVAQRSCGAWVEAAVLLDGALLEHLVIAPGGAALVGGVRVASGGRGIATALGHTLRCGESLRIPLGVAGGGRRELLVRFAPAPARIVST